jgi:hypothetical protein
MDPIRITNAAQARDLFRAHQGMFAARGVDFGEHADSYLIDGTERNFALAMDAQPQLITAPNAGFPSYLTTVIDPKVVRIVFQPLNAAEIFGEEARGSWTDDTVMFNVIEYVGEVSSYGDYSNNGMVNVNANWPQRQAYRYQAIVKYGDLEAERAGNAKLNWASEQKGSAVSRLNIFQNNAYFFGIAGLANYGIFNDPGLSAAVAPTPKVAGGVTWFTAGGAPNATPNEVYNDIMVLIGILVAQSGSTIDMQSPMTLALSSNMSVALLFANIYGVTVKALLKENFPNLKIVTAPQYGAQSAANGYGYVGGNFMQLFADNVAGQKTGILAYNAKLRVGRLVSGLSCYEQKFSQGTWGAVYMQPYAVASMVGI